MHVNSGILSDSCDPRKHESQGRGEREVADIPEIHLPHVPTTKFTNLMMDKVDRLLAFVTDFMRYC